ncbi:MAG: hypothetical protein CME65_09525 [Halobacteriovoraceae bacterium]|nr:hypothetical protein [Halobacteriovoraceae bacterium]|tara:strand:- start:13716 stop:14441 length:726 start_codon:yes stop_codon:yes gene_type:complete
MILAQSIMAQKDLVAPIDENNIINNGEIYNVKIISDKTSEELKEFENQKINDVMWVIDFYEESGNRFFEVFVTDPPVPKKLKANEEIKPEVPAFGVSGFKYEYIKKNTQGEIETLMVNFDEVEGVNLKLLVSLVLGFFVILFVWLVYLKKTNRKRKLKKLKKLKAIDLKEAFDKANSRSDFEKLYDERRYFIDLFQPEEELRDFFSIINRIQYKKEWSSQDMASLKKAKANIIGLRRRSGV